MFSTVKQAVIKVTTSETTQKVFKTMGQAFIDGLLNPIVVHILVATALGGMIGFYTILPVDLCASAGTAIGLYQALMPKK